MTDAKTTLEHLLQQGKGKALLFLGKEEIFDANEQQRFLKRFGIERVTEPTDNLVAVVEHRRLDPYEEQLSDRLYEEGVPLFRLETFERLLSESIEPDGLLMALRLGNDRARLLRMIANPYFDDTLFIRLLKLYRFDNAEEDSREDRDVIMHTLRRFVSIRPTEEDLLYSYLTLQRLARETSRADLLDALLHFPDFSFKTKSRQKTSLYTVVAQNPHLSSETIRRLKGMKQRDIDIALAKNVALGEEELIALLKKDDETIAQALAANEAIPENIFETLLDKSPETVSILLRKQPIDIRRLERIEEKNFDETLTAHLGYNRRMETDVKERLCETKNVSLALTLATNPTLPSKLLEKLRCNWGETLDTALAQNPSVSAETLRDIYERRGKEIQIAAALGANPSTEEGILRELFARDLFAINKALATNASLPKELLDILKLDTRLQHELAQNETLAKSYEAVLEQSKAMMNL